VTGEKAKKATELGQVIAALSELVGKVTQAETELGTRRTGRDEARAKMERLAPREMSQKLKALQAEVAELTGRTSELRSAKDTLDARIKLTQKRRDELIDSGRQLTEKLARLKKEGEEASALAVRSRTDLAALRKIEDSMGQEMNGLRHRKEQLFREKTSLEGERDRITGTVETKGEIIIGLNTRIAQAQIRIGELEEELKQLNTPIVLPAPTMDQLKDIIRQCESAISSMGPVNLKAVDDYAEKKARHDELSAETKRLDAQRKDLLKLEAELNQKKKAALLKVYDAVNQNFRRAYADLSQGGEAELLLENPDEPFQGGLAIKAKPKQGKVLRLEALSGGEKSLTALAFIFAIQEFQPSPFYLLDEVDMFLDGINADMVARRVQKSSKTAQFVQISLRKITLTKADHIIGVTKQEGGISHVIIRPNISDVSELPAELKIAEEKMEESL
jgi:chromosome segregation protein